MYIRHNIKINLHSVFCTRYCEQIDVSRKTELEQQTTCPPISLPPVHCLHCTVGGNYNHPTHFQSSKIQLFICIFNCCFRAMLDAGDFHPGKLILYYFIPGTREAGNPKSPVPVPGRFPVPGPCGSGAWSWVMVILYSALGTRQDTHSKHETENRIPV